MSNNFEEDVAMMWKMLKYLSICVLIMTIICGLLLFFESKAQAEEKEDIGVSFGTTTWSQFLNGSSGFVASERGVQQTSLTFTLPNGMYTNVWWSTSFDTNFSGDFADEIDWTLGKAGSVFGIGYDIGISYFDVVELGKTNGDFVQPYVELSRTFALTEDHTLAPFARWEKVFGFGDAVGGNYMHGGFYYRWQVSPILAMAISPRGIVDDGVGGLDKVIIGRLDLNLEWSLSETVAIQFPKIMTTAPLTQVDDGRIPALAVGAALNIIF